MFQKVVTKLFNVLITKISSPFFQTQPLSIYFCKKTQNMFYNTYILQTQLNGTTYTKGAVKDLLEDFNIACQDFPFKKFPKIKDLASNDWHDEDGLDVYIPEVIPVSHYDIDVTFLYKGSENDIRNDLDNFIKFLRGRNTGATGSRLAIYNEYVEMGRKDVVATEIDNKMFYIMDSAIDALAQFTVKFTVYDPTTEVTPVKTTVSGKQVVTGLNW